MNANTDEISYVTVNVHGNLRIPLHLSVLGKLDDPLLEQDILKESIKIALGEYLGWFSQTDIKLGSRVTSGGKSVLNCEANIPLEDLIMRVKAIQEAYDSIIKQAAVLTDLLSLSQEESEQEGAEGNSEGRVEKGKAGLRDRGTREKVEIPSLSWNGFKERDARMLALLESMLSSPPRIVDAACKLEQENRSLCLMQDTEKGQDLPSQPEPLLTGRSSETNVFDQDETNFGQGGIAEKEPVARDYTSMGYTRL